LRHRCASCAQPRRHRCCHARCETGIKEPGPRDVKRVQDRGTRGCRERRRNSATLRDTLMYLDYWKLAQRPFDERIDPEWFFSSGVHQGVSIQMQAIVQRRQPIAMLVGGVGSGKSMIAANLADQCDESRTSIMLHVSP